MLATLFTVALGITARSPVVDLFVDINAPNCGVGPTDPYCSISAAVAAAAPGDVVRIAPGTYVENLDLSFDITLIGTEGAAVTIVDGNQAGSVVRVQSAVTAVIDGLTLTNGLRNLEPGGGGVTLDGSLTLLNSTVTGNNAFAYVPGDYIGNLFGFRVGGGIGSGPLGSGDLTIESSTIESNSSSNSFLGAGGIMFQGAELVISNSTIRANEGFGSVYGYSSGGVTTANSGLVRISDCSLILNDGNYNGLGGGILCRSSPSVEIASCTIEDNFAGFGGGGIWSDNSSLVVRNTTISGNSAENGAGLSVINSVLSMFNVTTTANMADFGGGGMYFIPSSTITLANSIMAGNFIPTSSSGVVDIFPIGTNPGTVTSLGYNVIGVGNAGLVDGVLGDQVGTFSMPLDPLLAPLADNGGPTRTHEPLPGSPTIDNGHPTAFEPVDQRGVLRPQGLGSDVGAHEVGTLITDLCNGDGGDQAQCTPCPCANNAPVGTIGGCLNSASTSARLTRVGSSYVSNFTLRFEATAMTPQSFTVLTSGAATAPQNPQNPCFGLASGVTSVTLDGLRCAVQSVARHGSRATDVGGNAVTNSTWGNSIPTTLPNFAPGVTRTFQAFYRELPGAVCGTELNTTQAIVVTFGT